MENFLFCPQNNVKFRSKISALLLFFFFVQSLISQTYPVQISTQLIPPYSGYLPDNADPSSEKLKIILQFNDFSKPNYNLKLRVEIKGNGFTLITKQLFLPAPIQLQPGIPLLISGADLAPYLNANNLDFIGINQSSYEQRMALPEGYYSICVKAYDYYNSGNIQVSNEACASAWFTLSNPPLLNLPLCGQALTPLQPQSVLFQWTPVNISSPNSANSTDYEFALWEVRPDSSANPNQIVLSTAPIYSTTTNLPLLNYGITEPPLNLYMKYVWRVRAKDLSGRDWFQNNGYSQICTFTYGNLGNVLGNSLNLNLSAQGISHRLGQCSWNAQTVYSHYLLQVRKLGTTNWFDYKTNINSEKIASLEPETDYEARVRGEGNNLTGTWSNIATFRTLSAPVYGCGDQSQLADPLPASPLPVSKAVPGLIVQTGQFEMTVTQIMPNGQQGWYNGKGYAKVFGLPVAVQFANIYIDDNNRHQQGTIQALTKGINAWIQQWDIQYAEENATYISGSITGVSTSSNQICVSIQGHAQDSCFSIPPNQNVVVVRDAQGNQYTIQLIPPPPKITGPTNYFTFSNENLEASDSLMVNFEQSPDQTFGFDKQQYAAWAKNYEVIKLKNGKNYFVPYKSVGENASDKVIARITIVGFEANKLSFKTQGGQNCSAIANGTDKYELSVPDHAQCVYAWYDGKKIGKLNVVSLKALTKKLVIVPVNNANLSGSNLQSDLNKIYAQANITFSVSTKSSFSFDLGGDGLEKADATLMSKYSSEMRSLRDAYRKYDSLYDKQAYYIFVVPNFNDPSVKGYMVRGRALGFVAANASAKEIAHELAHGAFGLEHTFPSIPKSSSQNLMDYKEGYEISKVQWEEMENSRPIFNWLDEEEDAAFSASDLEGWLKNLFGISCINSYKNYEGIIPECFWNNNIANNTADNGYGCALICGILDGAFQVTKDVLNTTSFVNCWSPIGYGIASTECFTVREKTIETYNTLRNIITKPETYKTIYNELIKQLADWDVRTECLDRTCAYNQGRAIFDLISLFYGGGEIKALLNTGIAGTKVIQMFKAVDNTLYSLFKVFKKAGHQIKKTGLLFQLCLKLNGNPEFIVGTIDNVKKAIKFTTPELSSIIQGTIIKKLDNVSYLDASGVVKKADIELIEYGGSNNKVAGWRKVSRIVYKNVSFEDFAKTVKNANVEQLEKAYRLWGEEKWLELYDYFNPPNAPLINEGLPPYYGFKEITHKKSGSELLNLAYDRFQGPGSISGEFASPVYQGENLNNLFFTFDSRALNSSITNGTNYIKFKFKSNIPTDLSMEFGEVIPWFGKLGLGDQVRCSKKFADIKDYIEITERFEYINGSWK